MMSPAAETQAHRVAPSRRLVGLVLRLAGDTKGEAGSPSRLAAHAAGGARSIREHRGSGDDCLVQIALSCRR